MKFLFEDSNLDIEAIRDSTNTLGPYLKYLQQITQQRDYSSPEWSLNLPSDEDILSKVLSLKEKKVSPNLKYFIDIGIGGSNLGTKAIYDVLFGSFDLLQPIRFPKMIFSDTTDPEFLYFLAEFLENNIITPEEVLINVISKSGTTTETVYNLEAIMHVLIKKSPNYLSRLVITTDEGSRMWHKAFDLGVDVLDIPKLVGGRYSVFSSVGLFPLSCIGIDILDLRDGARSICELLLQQDILSIPAAISAAVLYLQNKSGRNIHDSFFFHPELESVGKWYRQLTGESVGKEKDLNGKEIHAGITPTVSLGSTDLHSLAQLFLGGPTDKIT